MDLDKLKHSYNVAKKMKKIGEQLGLNEEEKTQLFILGLNHDIGYEFIKDNERHNQVGGIILKNSSYQFWKEVYYHGETNIEYESLYLDILNLADMQIDKYGEDVGFENRLLDIEIRYQEKPGVYQKCLTLVNHLKNKYPNL